MLQHKHHYHLQSSLSKLELQDRLKSNTLVKTTLILEKTSKLFTGQLSDYRFKLIESNPIGSLCILHGSIMDGKPQTSIVIETMLHPAYKRLLIVGFLILTALITALSIQEHSLSLFFTSFLWLIGIGTVFYGFVYIIYSGAKNTALASIERLVS